MNTISRLFYRNAKHSLPSISHCKVGFVCVLLLFKKKAQTILIECDQLCIGDSEAAKHSPYSSAACGWGLPVPRCRALGAKTLLLKTIRREWYSLYSTYTSTTQPAILSHMEPQTISHASTGYVLRHRYFSGQRMVVGFALFGCANTEPSMCRVNNVLCSSSPCIASLFRVFVRR